MADTVLVERRDEVAIITLNLPRKRNALGVELVAALSRVLTDIQDDRSVHALVLTGGTHFCVGGDLGGLHLPILEMRRSMLVGHRMIRALVGGRLPAVAAVEGNAYGAGFSLALACDFVVADDKASFCAAFGKVNLVPDYGLMWTLTQRVGMGRMREIVMLCEAIPGSKAYEWGLVDRLSEPGKVLDGAIELAQRLVRQPTGSMAATKAALARLPLNLDTLLAWEADTQAVLSQSGDFLEAVQAFAEKRPPNFAGT
ncbi:MAG: enoyl-CoA hydratase/isomerase family protein [Nevskia sp.]|nr:enoyl-CoA hydratase/isomerase family protein [Nevskia sp.]